MCQALRSFSFFHGGFHWLLVFLKYFLLFWRAAFDGPYQPPRSYGKSQMGWLSCDRTQIADCCTVAPSHLRQPYFLLPLVNQQMNIKSWQVKSLSRPQMGVQRAWLKPRPDTQLNILHSREFQPQRDRKSQWMMDLSLTIDLLSLCCRGFCKQLGLSIKD